MDKKELLKMKAAIKYVPLQGNYLLVHQTDLEKYIDNNFEPKAIGLKNQVMLLPLYENYYKAAEKLFEHLTKDIDDIPDKYYVPYATEKTSLQYEIYKLEKAKA